MARGYIGRFAPSPTGPLHLGSLFAALVSYLDARAHRGQWHLRIDDIDTTRTVAGADLAIVETLKAHGLDWDGDIVYQTQQYAAYHDALTTLQQRQRCFQCDCNRKRLAGKPYDGYCRTRQQYVTQPCAWRFQSQTEDSPFEELWFKTTAIPRSPDPIIWRKDGLCAYQLAVVVDDYQLGVNHIIRGADLYATTSAQVQIYEALGYPVPSYGHFPVLLNKHQRKLSKQNHAQAVDNAVAADNLKQCFDWLHIDYNPKEAVISQLLASAIAQWSRDKLPSHDVITGQN